MKRKNYINQSCKREKETSITNEQYYKQKIGRTQLLRLREPNLIKIMYTKPLAHTNTSSVKENAMCKVWKKSNRLYIMFT